MRSVTLPSKMLSGDPTHLRLRIWAIGPSVPVLHSQIMDERMSDFKTHTTVSPRLYPRRMHFD